MATLVESRFGKVPQISSPGKFVFATNPNINLGIQTSNLGDVSGVIVGARPEWLHNLYNTLKREYPEIECISQFKKDEDDSSSEWVEEMVPWTGQSGKIVINGEMYRVNYGAHLFHSREVEFNLQALNSKGEIKRGGPPGYHIQGGVVELKLNQSEEGELYHGKTFWNGELELDGQDLREPIQKVINKLNRDVKYRRISVWQDLQWEPPVSKLGPRFLSATLTTEQATSA